MQRCDRGLSPVIAVILMVAVTVVLAATVYAWVSGFQESQREGALAAVSAQRLDADNDGLTDWVRVSLVRAADAPFGQATISVNWLDASGAVLTDQTTNGILCLQPSAQGTGPYTCAASQNFMGSANTAWDLGETFYIPCQGAGAHQLTIAVRGVTALDQRIVCEEAAA